VRFDVGRLNWEEEWFDIGEEDKMVRVLFVGDWLGVVGGRREKGDGRVGRSRREEGSRSEVFGL